MKDHVSLQERLKDLRVEKGLKLEELAEKTGISKSALASYENEENRNKEINHGNLITLADFYEVSIDYLFCRTENREQINTPLSELHLTDEAVALLKSGRINTRLLCEMMKNSRNCWQTQKSMWTEWPPCGSMTSTVRWPLSGQ